MMLAQKNPSRIEYCFFLLCIQLGPFSVSLSEPEEVDERDGERVFFVFYYSSIEPIDTFQKNGNIFEMCQCGRRRTCFFVLCQWKCCLRHAVNSALIGPLVPSPSPSSPLDSGTHGQEQTQEHQCDTAQSLRLFPAYSRCLD